MKLLIQRRSLILVFVSVAIIHLTSIEKGSSSVSFACNPYEQNVTDTHREYSDGVVNLQAGRTINALMVFIEFENKKKVGSDLKKLLKVVKSVTNFYAAMSENSITFEWQTYKDSIELHKDVSNYEANFRGNLGVAQIVVDVQNAIRRYEDIDQWDFILVVTPSTTLRSEVSNSVAYLNRGEGIVNSAILASDFWKSGHDWRIVAHEIGHAFGLLDLYSLEAALLVSEEKAAYFDQFSFMKSYDLMNWPSSSSPSFLMWNRIQLTSMQFSRIVCFKDKVTKYRLISVNSYEPGFKAIFALLPDSRVLIVEVRDNKGVDFNIDKSDMGVITYVVDLRTESGKGPLRIVCNQVNNAQLSDCGLKSGQSRVIAGFRVTLERTELGQYIVSVVKKRS